MATGWVSAKAIFDFYRFTRYITFIANTDKRADMKQILTHSAQLGQILATRRRASKLSQRALAAQFAVHQKPPYPIEKDPGTLTPRRASAGRACDRGGAALRSRGRAHPDSDRSAGVDRGTSRGR